MKSDTISAVLNKYAKDVQSSNPNISKQDAMKKAEEIYANSFNEQAIENLKRTPNRSAMKAENLRILKENGKI